jgi:DNA-binding MarR family transcriptional regulator
MSQLLVAFTVELDNQFESRMADQFAPSLVLWSNLMQFVDENGVAAGEIARLARVTMGGLLPGLACVDRHGYVTVDAERGPCRARQRRADGMVNLTAAGQRARAAWGPLPGVIEERWRARVGHGAVAGLRESLEAVASRLDLELPEYVQGGLIAGAAGSTAGSSPDRAGIAAAARCLPALLSQVLLAFTIEYEREPGLPLAVSANALRVLSSAPVSVGDLPRLTGVSKQAARSSAEFLARYGYAVTEPGPSSGRARVIRITGRGAQARAASQRRTGIVEASWRTRFGPSADRLREALQAVLTHPGLGQGLEPLAGGWRARAPYVAQARAMMSDPGTALPHYPVVHLHRGGFPDGS